MVGGVIADAGGIETRDRMLGQDRCSLDHTARLEVGKKKFVLRQYNSNNASRMS